MARITTVEKARKDQGLCYTCHQEIQAGTSYRWTKPSRYSMRFAWHNTCANPPGSVLETNDKRATAMAAFEDLYDNLDTILNGIDLDVASEDQDSESWQSEVDEAIDQAASQVEEAAEMWRESASAIEDGFGHATYQSDEMNDRADEYEDVAGTLRSIETTPDEEPEDYISRIKDETSSAEGDLT